MRSPAALSAHGLKVAKLPPSLPMVTTSVSTSSPTLNASPAPIGPLKRKRSDSLSATPVSVHNIRNPTSNGKSPSSSNTIPTMKSTATLGAGLTLRGPTLSSFWTPSTQALSARLSLPTRTGYAALVPNSCSASWRKLALGSWFTAQQWSSKQTMSPTITNSAMTPLASLPSLLRTVTDNAQQGIANAAALTQPSKKKKQKTSQAIPSVPKPEAARTKKIRVYPTLKQRQVLVKWIGASRWTYNQCVHGIEKEGLARQKKVLRDYCINDSKHLRDKALWLLETPYAIRNEAMCDVLKAYTTGFAQFKAKQISRFDMTRRERSLKDKSTSIVIHSSHWEDTSKIFYRAAFEKAGAEDTLQTSEPLPEKILYDCRLQRTRLGHYYFCLLLPVTRSENQAPIIISDTTAVPRILSIDPGVRTFLTGYEPSTGTYVEWGKGDMKRIERLLGHLDNLISRTAKSKSKRQRYTMRKAQWRLRLRVQNLVGEFHKKLVAWLVQTYELVLLPHYKTRSMVVKTTRKISRPSVRAMLSWSSYQFKERLLMKAKDTSCSVILVDEHYTTMTCGECGHLHRNVGTAKVFDCPVCLTRLPRDWNAARNIFLRYVASSSTTSTLQGNAGLGPRPLQRKLDATTDGMVI